MILLQHVANQFLRISLHRQMRCPGVPEPPKVQMNLLSGSRTSRVLTPYPDLHVFFDLRSPRHFQRTLPCCPRQQDLFEKRTVRREAFAKTFNVCREINWYRLPSSCSTCLPFHQWNPDFRRPSEIACVKPETVGTNLNQLRRSPQCYKCQPGVDPCHMRVQGFVLFRGNKSANNHDFRGTQ